MVFEKIRIILAEQLDLDEDTITMDSNIAEDLGADSMDVVDLITSKTAPIANSNDIVPKGKQAVISSVVVISEDEALSYLE